MSGQTLASLPPIKHFEAIECPIERAAQLTVAAKDFRTLPSAHAALRRESLEQARTMRHPDGGRYTLKDLAERVGVSFARVWRLTQGTPTRTSTRTIATGETS